MMQLAGLLLILTWTLVDSARILIVIPTPSISHQVVARPLVQELVKRGHEVTLITTDPSYERGKAPANLTEIDVHDISYKHFQELLLNHKGKASESFDQILKLIKRLGTVLDLQLQTPEVQDVLKKPKDYFDVLIIESCSRVGLGFAKKFNAPLIQFSSFGTISSHFSLLGTLSHPILFPTVISQRLYNLSRWEKVIQIIKEFALYYVYQYTKEDDLKIIQKHFGEDADIDEIMAKNVKMLLINEHPIWAENRPLPPNIHYIGGIHQTPDKELPKESILSIIFRKYNGSDELTSFLDSSKNGVIYMSFGSNVFPSLLPEDKKEIITKVLSKLQYDILLKWDDDKIPNQPPNVKVQTWFPQSTLLKHPKIKLFITQAGLQSTDEAINAGVPLLAIPMLGDQWYNAEKYVRHQIGLQLDIHALNEDVFHNAITTIVTDKSYKKNMLRLRALMREYPILPVDLAAWWTEHIIMYGGDHLMPPSAYLKWTEYYEIELVLICLGVVLAFLCVLFYICKYSCRTLIRLLNFNVKIKTKLE